MTNHSAINKLDLKRYNRSEILWMISRLGPMGRVDLASHLRLTRAAMTQITNELISEGILYEVGEEKLEGRKVPRGRKKILLDINENNRFSFGVVLDRFKVNIGLANLYGQTLARKMIPLKTQNLTDIIELIVLQIKEILSENYLDLDLILGIGACVSDNAVVLFPCENKRECLEEFRRLLEERAGVPVIAEGTTEGLAVAETVFRRGTGRKTDDLVLIRYGYDLDAAIMTRGQIYQGPRNAGGRLAHLVVDVNGDECSCGKRGCCMTRLSVPEIMQKMRRLYSREQTPLLFEETQGNRESVDFGVDHWRELAQKEPVYQALLQEAVRYLAAVLNNILVLLNPDQIVLFGFMFEKVLDLPQLLETMNPDCPEALERVVVKSMISDANIHLAGNGLCVRELFIDLGGYQNLP
jgi:N-acetylglucosamine repressor